MQLGNSDQSCSLKLVPRLVPLVLLLLPFALSLKIKKPEYFSYSGSFSSGFTNQNEVSVGAVPALSGLNLQPSGYKPLSFRNFLPCPLFIHLSLLSASCFFENSSK